MTDNTPDKLPLTMTAWTQSRYGEPDVVGRGQVDVPSPRSSEVLVRVRATGLNNGDVRVMRGEPLVVRTAFGIRRPKQAVRGMDVAGTVVSVGPGVTGFVVGDEVVGELPGGGLAEFAIAPVKRLVARPEALDPVTAAALPVAGVTAWQTLARGGVTSGDRVLILGASGGVGTFAVQLAALRGAEVHATCGQRNRTLVEGLGATRTFDYQATDASTLGPESYDVVIDISGTAPLPVLQRLVRDGGRIVLVSGEGGRFWGPIGRIAAASVRSIGSKRKVLMQAAVARPDDLRELISLVVDGQLVPVIERTWPLAEAGAALAHVTAGHTVGKIVVLAD